jgi:hypothetical protein
MSKIIWNDPPTPWSPMHGYPGWKFWTWVIGLLFLVWLAVKLFYKP